MLSKILEDINSLDGVKGSLVASKEGLVIAHKVEPGLDIEAICAIVAIASNYEKNMARKLENDPRTGIADDKELIAINGDKAILAVVVEPKRASDVLFRKMSDTIGGIERYLGLKGE